MSEGLPKLKVTRRSGSTPFTNNGVAAPFTLLSFWEWASSDLTSNVLRGILAEYLVAESLGLARGVRDPWLPYDLKTEAGLTIEVKSGAYLQSWWQRRPTEIVFLIPPTRSWNPDDGTFQSTQQRQALVYVFAVLTHQDKPSLDPLDLRQWHFYVIDTSVINEHCKTAKSISLKRLLKLKPTEASFDQLRSVVSDFERSLLAAS